MTISYGTYKDIVPLFYSKLDLHYSNNQPHPIFTKAEKVIEISHWGNIKVDEYFDMTNEVAKIDGEFNRVEFNSYNPRSCPYALRSMETLLPKYIHDLYYYDYIGNISTSTAFRSDDNVQFSIEPRFAIFGGWKTDWNIGYSMPTSKHLF